MAAFVDKENIQPFGFVNRNPLDLLTDAKHELDAEVAKGVQKRVVKELEREKQLEEKAGAALARRLHIEEHDAQLAALIHAGEKAEHDRATLQRRKSVAEDAALALKLAASMELEARVRKQRVADQSEADAAFAKKLQSQEDEAHDKRIEELNWTNPAVTVTQIENSVRFAVRLPGLAHANVSINHSASGDTTLGIEATPITPRTAVTTGGKALQNFLFDFKLTSAEPLQLDAKDISVSYDEKTEDLNIVCANLKLNDQQKASFVDRLKAFFGKSKAKPAATTTGATK